jgi:hypothetical protein
MGIQASSGVFPANPGDSSVGGGLVVVGACSPAAGTSASPPALAGERRHHPAVGARLPVVPSEVPPSTSSWPGRRIRAQEFGTETDRHTTASDDAVSVACRDVAGRRRVALAMPLPDQRVMVFVPPGEVADLEVAEAARLREVLHAFAPTHRVESSSGVTVWGPYSGTVPCADAIGRPRAVTVVTTPYGRVKVVAPAGAVAVFAPMGLVSFGSMLRAAIGAVRVEAAIA